MKISVTKQGNGVFVTYGWRGAKGLSSENFPARFKVSLLDNWAIVFGAVENLTNRDLKRDCIFLNAFLPSAFE
jgi:hypothetical protein